MFLIGVVQGGAESFEGDGFALTVADLAASGQCSLEVVDGFFELSKAPVVLAQVVQTPAQAPSVVDLAEGVQRMLGVVDGFLVPAKAAVAFAEEVQGPALAPGSTNLTKDRQCLLQAGECVVISAQIEVGHALKGQGCGFLPTGADFVPDDEGLVEGGDGFLKSSEIPIGVREAREDIGLAEPIVDVGGCGEAAALKADKNRWACRAEVNFFIARWGSILAGSVDRVICIPWSWFGVCAVRGLGCVTVCGRLGRRFSRFLRLGRRRLGCGRSGSRAFRRRLTAALGGRVAAGRRSVYRITTSGTATGSESVKNVPSIRAVPHWIDQPSRLCRRRFARTRASASASRKKNFSNSSGVGSATNRPYRPTCSTDKYSNGTDRNRRHSPAHAIPRRPALPDLRLALRANPRPDSPDTRDRRHCGRRDPLLAPRNHHPALREMISPRSERSPVIGVGPAMEPERTLSPFCEVRVGGPSTVAQAVSVGPGSVAARM